ncbi:lytic polysaccharide monooxygenase [Actinokineospora sp. HUAS TT18]|uniref:lytic polysaccharide monooxygenase n=1 Tax=Actinokineospora sp. HUAS TT18 TaxID=3447451 RepID=UPI003F520B67
MKRRIALLAGACLAPLVLVVLQSTPAMAHGYISDPPSRQAVCAQGKIADCGPIIWEPQSVEGPKGQKNCHGGLSQFAQLNDDSRNWPAKSVPAGRVTFNWIITARHSTLNWEYFIGDTRIAVFNDGGARPPATFTHVVDLSGYPGRQKLRVVWNVADTPMAFYNCVDLQVGGSTPPTTTPPTTTPPTTTPPTTTPPTTTTTPPSTGTWAAGTTYATGATVTYNGGSYRCAQGHTALSGWEPDVTPALWTRI